MSAEELYKSSVKLLNEQNYKNAFENLQKAFDLSGRMWASREVWNCMPEIKESDEAKLAYREYLDYLVDHDSSEAGIIKANEMLSGSVYPKDVDGAIKLYERLAERGESLAAEMLGEIYFLGEDVKPDYAKALQYFQSCGETHSYIKRYYMGLMYMNGVGVEKDTAKAVEYFRGIVDSDDPWKTMDGLYYKAQERLAEIDTGEAAGRNQKE